MQILKAQGELKQYIIRPSTPALTIGEYVIIHRTKRKYNKHTYILFPYSKIFWNVCAILRKFIHQLKTC
jgi:hypothetical protein